ncbi:major facilitator superfamily domain-containing protein [Truncatella angustata]|uniref:Major facilitator superfamily domain-containing protein n=1 Tax=Truncatella angustata TaxID=152316 RepID=A0A9P9A5U9_9PEZI|nr:major facilitator superfamily domain-containing protein [Truncatella angustata]KAH6661204.1 major facilitator superfamily domain-containing protein [Truncatella angustata]
MTEFRHPDCLPTFQKKISPTDLQNQTSTASHIKMSPWNWPLWWRMLILLNMSFYNFLGNAFAAGVPPLFGLIIEEFDVTTEQVSGLSTFVLLALGLSNIFALPSEAIVGKRFTIIISLVVFLAASIWSGEAATFESLRAARIIGGLAGGLVEALGPTVVVEIFPEHQLGRAMVIYVGFLAAGSALGPVVAGAVASQLGSWRWYARILSMGIFANLVGCLAMLPETSHGTNSGITLPEPTDLVDKDELSDKPQQMTKDHVGNDVPLESGGKSMSQIYWIRSWSLLYVRQDWRAAIALTYQPLQLCAAPQIVLTVLVFGLTIGWTVLTSILLPNVYQAPPLLWGPLQIGLFNFAPFIGLVIGLPVGGFLADRISNRATRQHYHDPRNRLPMILFGGLISPAGCIIMGYGLQSSTRWIIVAIGYAMLTTGLTSSANVLLTYSVDCFPQRAGHIGVLVNITKNCLAFGVSYATMDWYMATGPLIQYATMGGLLWFAYLFVIPMYIFSKRLLRTSSRWAV